MTLFFLVFQCKITYKNKESITGYQYEPWHLRYLGKKKATKVYKSGETLEEFVGLK